MPFADTSHPADSAPSNSAYAHELATATRLARLHGMPCIDLAAFDLRALRASGRLSPNLQRKCHSLLVAPLATKVGPMAFAISEPELVARIRETLQPELGGSLKWLLVTPSALKQSLDTLDVLPGDAPGGAVQSDSRSGHSAQQASEPRSAVAVSAEKSEAPAVQLVNRILDKAIADKASDIHFEPFEDSYRVRLRRDGVLATCETPGMSLAAAVSARIKVMAKMDISERRLPQDGRIRLPVSDSRHIDLRVNSLPTLWGEKLVLRVLGGGQEVRALEDIGMSSTEQRLYAHALQKSQGLILVTGPTGSGKTVTLYAGLERLNTHERNILAVEDPVEITLSGINQVQINTRVGLSFASVLRAFLRQDPDVIMLGEIRDQETAEIAVRAAQTGHIVLATLHTNSALETPGRLIDMGVPSYLLASALSLVVSQRLVRRLCPYCALADAHGKQPNPDGCTQCLAGYSGRQGVYEMLPVTSALAEALSRQTPLADIERSARSEGFSSLHEAGLRLVAEGVTSLSEVQRVCS